jgi:hypothetical protein
MWLTLGLLADRGESARMPKIKLVSESWLLPALHSDPPPSETALRRRTPAQTDNPRIRRECGLLSATDTMLPLERAPHAQTDCRF